MVEKVIPGLAGENQGLGCEEPSLQGLYYVVDIVLGRVLDRLSEDVIFPLLVTAFS